MNVVFIMLGGVGTRFGASVPKQFIKTSGGKPIFLPIVEAYASESLIDRIIIVVPESWKELASSYCSNLLKSYTLVSGGRTRSHSIKNALASLKGEMSDNDVVLIHDATHPYLDSGKIKEVITETCHHGAATLATFGYDTVYEIDGNDMVQKVLPRTRVVNGASPEAFQYHILDSIYSKATDNDLSKMTSAAALCLSRGGNIKFIQTDILNLKITYKRDYELLERIGLDYFYQ